MIHILRKLGDRNITADKLKEAADGSKRQLKPPTKSAILDKIFKVRRMEERYEDGKNW